MRFLSPAAFWWLLLAAPIVFLYLLKRRRKRQIVPSTLLWRRAIEDLEANVPFKTLRRNLLLFLQLLALLAAVLGMARPAIPSHTLVAAGAVLVIDSSASMAARDADGSRLERARGIAREIIDGMAGSSRMALIDASSASVLRAPLTGDKATLRSALGQVRQTDAPGDLRAALLLAEEIVRPEKDAEIVLIGDGGGLESSRAGGGQAKVRFIRVGTRSENVGIIAMTCRQVGGGRQQVFASIVNFGEKEYSIPMELRIDGKLADARTVLLGPRSRTATQPKSPESPGTRSGENVTTQPDHKSVVFDSVPTGGGLAELKLDVQDDLAADNTAYLSIPDSRSLHAGIISDNRFLLQALKANPDLQVTALSSPAEASNGAYDLIAVEGDATAALLKTNLPLLIINPPAEPGFWSAAQRHDPPSPPVSVDRAHPVNSFLGYDDLQVEAPLISGPAAWLKPIVGGPESGLILAGDDGTRRIVVVTFDLAKSNFPLTVEFPLMLANAATWITRRAATATTERAVVAGRPLIMKTEGGSLQVTTPDGKSQSVQASDGLAVLADTNQVGLYQVASAGAYAVSLLSESESDTAPRDFAGSGSSSRSGPAGVFKSERTIWPYLLVAVLIILSIEWFVYCKRIAT